MNDNIDDKERNDDVIINTIDITKIYKFGEREEVRALKGVNLKILRGEFVAIMGPSGSGKSTLMNILGCLDTPTSGKYFLENIDVSKLNDNQLAEIRNRKVGFVFQTFNLLPRLDAFHNVGLPLIYSKNGSKDDRKERILTSLESVGLKGLEKHRPNELSGGERQRVAIARALVNNPSIILADEPTGNLDSRSGEEIMAIFQKLNRQGRTILLVTHELDIAKHTQKIIYLRDGIIHNYEKIDKPIDAEQKLQEMPRLEDEIKKD